MFFQSAAQFWGALGVYGVLVAVTWMPALRHRLAYRNVLLMLQESLRREGLLVHTVWVYDDLLRRRYKHAVVLGVQVDPEEFFVKLHPEILRDAKAPRPCFDRPATSQTSQSPVAAPVVCWDGSVSTVSGLAATSAGDVLKVPSSSVPEVFRKQLVFPAVPKATGGGHWRGWSCVPGPV